MLWVLKEFRTQLLLVAAAATASGYAFGCFSKAKLSAGGAVSVFELNAAPERFNARNVCVRGTLLNLKETGAEAEDLPYSIFSLKETRGAGDYDFVSIISLREREAAPAGLVLACGVFSEMKQIGKDTYHNVILLNRFKSEAAGKYEGPLRGGVKSRTF